MQKFLPVVTLFLCLLGFTPSVSRATDAPSPNGNIIIVTSDAGRHAVSAAAQAGMMYKFLLIKGLMDSMQRQELDHSLENLNEKLKTVKKEAAMGKIGPGEYAAIKAAVDDAYVRNAKVEASKDLEVGPDLKIRSEKSALKFDGPMEPNKANQNLADKKALQASDLAKAEKTHLSNEMGQSLDRKPSSDLWKDSNNSLQSGLNPSAQPLLVSDRSGVGAQTLAIHNSSESDSSSKDKMEAKVHFNQESSLEGSSQGSPAWDLQSGENLFHGGDLDGDMELETLQKEDRMISGREETEANFGGGIGHWLKPVKFQKNPFSTKVQSEEGLHPAILLLVLGLAFVWGRKVNQPKKVPVVIPEVVRTPRRAKSKALVSTTYRSGRRRSRRN